MNTCEDCKELLKELHNIRATLVQVYHLMAFIPKLDAMSYIDVIIHRIDLLIEKHSKKL